MDDRHLLDLTHVTGVPPHDRATPEQKAIITASRDKWLKKITKKMTEIGSQEKSVFSSISLMDELVRAHTAAMGKLLAAVAFRATHPERKKANVRVWKAFGRWVVTTQFLKDALLQDMEVISELQDGIKELQDEIKELHKELDEAEGDT